MERASVGHLEPEGSPIGRIPEIRWLLNTIMERALTRGEYLLSGGVRSDYYIDKFKLFADPSVLRRIARLFSPVVAETEPDLIAGTEIGGVILATAVSQMTNIPMIVVRKAPKAFGAFADEYVEGPYRAGQRVLLLEDVVTSGREVLAAKERLEALKLEVVIWAVINRGLAPVKSLVQFSLPRSDAKTEN
jgi:orotate phosphoribosyltransferase